jgi:hypothetical protein
VFFNIYLIFWLIKKIEVLVSFFFLSVDASLFITSFLIKLFSDYSFTFLKVEKWIYTIIGIWFLRVIKLNFKLTN